MKATEELKKEHQGDAGNVRVENSQIQMDIVNIRLFPLGYDSRYAGIRNAEVPRHIGPRITKLSDPKP